MVHIKGFYILSWAKHVLVRLASGGRETPQRKGLVRAGGHPAGIPHRQPLKADKHLQQLLREYRDPARGQGS